MTTDEYCDEIDHQEKRIREDVIRRLAAHNMELDEFGDERDRQTVHEADMYLQSEGW